MVPLVVTAPLLFSRDLNRRRQARRFLTELLYTCSMHQIAQISNSLLQQSAAFCWATAKADVTNVNLQGLEVRVNHRTPSANNEVSLELLFQVK